MKEGPFKRAIEKKDDDTWEVTDFGKDPRTRKEKVSRKALIPRPDKKD